MVATAERKKSRCALRPLGDRVVILPEEREKISKGGIVLPDNAQEPPVRGIVMAVGDGEITKEGRLEMEIKEGDKVLFGRYSGTEVDLGDDVTVRMMRQGDVLAVLER